MATIRIFKHYIPTQFLLLGLLELLLLGIAFFVGVELRFMDATPAVREHVLPLFPKAVTFALVVTMTMIALGLYQRNLREGMEAMALRLIASFLVSVVPLTFLYYLVPGLYLGRGALLLAMVVALPLTLGLRYYFFRFVDQDLLKRRVLVLGAGGKASMISQLRRQTDHRGFKVVGYVHMPGDQDLDAEGRVEQENVIKLTMSLLDYVREQRVDELVLAVDDRRNALPVDAILDCKMDGVQVLDLLSFFEREFGKVLLEILQPSWMFLSDGFDQGILRSFSKRAFDIAFALVLLPVLLPLMALVVLAVYLEDPRAGSILFSQVRVGRNSQPFTIYKFRSMNVAAEEDGVARWAAKNDVRITRVGSIIRKVRLDELPQIFNVLRGEMSFVGPRPERPEFVSQLEESIPYFRERHRVKPGLTGWAQIRYQYGSSERDAFEKLQYDLYYVKNHGIFLDLLILLTTAEVVLWGKGAH